MTGRIDWWLIGSIIPLYAIGLLTMNSFTGDDPFFIRQLIWVLVSIAILFIVPRFDMRHLRDSRIVTALYFGGISLLVLVLIFGREVKGAQSWFDLGPFAFQPADLMKLALIMVLAKYFSRRHVEIAHVKHIIVSGAYAALISLLVLLQPDFGTTMILIAIWFGMVLVSGISKKHVLIVIGAGLLSFVLMWAFVFQDYQKARIKTFISPLTDIRGTGYNAYQSMVAVGSGELIGKGIGYGTQSKLKFLPEYETDFIFAAYAEEWGFGGVVIFLILFSIVIGRVITNAIRAPGNFEMLFGVGLAIFLTAHFTVNVGMNIGLLPVTGVTLPFLSYGGTHLLVEALGIAILMGMRGRGKELFREKPFPTS